MSRKKNEILEKLRLQFEAAEKERREREQEYLQEKYKADADLIRNAIVDEMISLDLFASLKASDKKMVAKMYARSLFMFLSSEEVENALDEAEMKRSAASRKRAERKNKATDQAQPAHVYQPVQFHNRQDIGSIQPGIKTDQ